MDNFQEPKELLSGQLGTLNRMFKQNNAENNGGWQLTGVLGEFQINGLPNLELLTTKKSGTYGKEMIKVIQEHFVPEEFVHIDEAYAQEGFSPKFFHVRAKKVTNASALDFFMRIVPKQESGQLGIGYMTVLKTKAVDVREDGKLQYDGNYRQVTESVQIWAVPKDIERLPQGASYIPLGKSNNSIFIARIIDPHLFNEALGLK